MQISGAPADVCPYCGCAMFVNGTRAHDVVIYRYVKCRNSSCGKLFESQQFPATLTREIETSERPEDVRDTNGDDG